MADYWTITSLSTQGGIGKDALRDAFSTEYTFPAGQNGNKASYYWYTDGTHEQTFATPANIVAVYTLDAFGNVQYILDTHSAGNLSVPGGGDATFDEFYTPYSKNTLIDAGWNVGGKGTVASAEGVPYLYSGSSNNHFELRTMDAASAKNVAENEWDDAPDDLELIVTYRAF